MTLWFNESYIRSQFDMLVDDLDQVDIEHVALDGEHMRYIARLPSFTVNARQLDQLREYIRAIDGTLEIVPDGDALAFTFTAHKNKHMPME